MSKPTPANPFLDDDDELDDNAFLSHPSQGNSGYLLRSDSDNEWEQKRLQLLQERRRIEESTLQSTNVSLGILHESEQVGILTAEELVRQGEQLENIEENLDIINSTMRTSQKHINSIKSMFGGIKNFFNKSETKEPPKPDNSLSNQPSTLKETVGSLRADQRANEASHPAYRIRDLPYGDDDSNLEVAKDRVVSPTTSKIATNNYEEKLDKNIDLMSLGLGRLKNLAIGLNEEIEQQNEKLDTIHDKTDRVEETLEHQNRQIKRILKK